MVDAGEDFGGYMDNLAAAEEEAARHQRVLDDHEAWRQNSWGGFVVRTLQGTAKHFKPFFMKVAEMMRDDESTGKRILIFFLNIFVIFVCMLFVYALGRVFGYLIGGDIIQEEEVVVVHEHETEEDAQKARDEERRKNSRGKKKKATKEE